MNNRNPITPMENLYVMYGRKPPVQITGRLRTEDMIASSQFYRDEHLIGILRQEAEKAGTDISVSGNYAALTSWAQDCSDINPLPSHYRCRKCHKVVFCGDGDGWDLPYLECCGEPSIRDGHNISIESVQDTLNGKFKYLEFRIAESFAEQAEEIIGRYYRKEYELVPFEDELVHCSRQYALVPERACRYADLEGEPLQLDADRIHEKGYSIIALSYDKRKEQIRTLRQKTGLKPELDDLLTGPVMALVAEKLKEDIRTEGATLLETGELSFSTLLKLTGYRASAHTEENPVYHKENGKLSEVFTCREEVWDLISGALKPEYGISTEFARKVTHHARCGMYTGNRMKPGTAEVLRGLGIDQWWISQLQETYYLPAKADMIARLLDMLKLTWYELKAGVYGEAADKQIGSDETLLEKHICKECGAEFTLPEAVIQCRQKLEWPPYLYENTGEICGECAAKAYLSKVQQDE